MTPTTRLPVLLFGYDSSAFTQKVRLALRLKQIPYTFILVPSMMPRPTLRDFFNITYRKIPVLSIGRDTYIDTSLICEALEHRFPESAGFGTLYPSTGAGGRNRSLIRGVASFWTDRPFFRGTCGLMPASVWRSAFGRDRAGLIGHQLDAAKLERKIPRMMGVVDSHLSLFEGVVGDGGGWGEGWLMDTKTPSLMDIAVFYQLDWGVKIARGYGVEDLTQGEAQEGGEKGADEVFNEGRYPKLWGWYVRMKEYFGGLPLRETRVEKEDREGLMKVKAELEDSEQLDEIPVLPTPAPQQRELDERDGLVHGARVSIAPDDTGRDDPSLGTLLAASPEEIVIEPENVDGHSPAVSGLRIHFPRIGFVVNPASSQRASSRL